MYSITSQSKNVKSHPPSKKTLDVQHNIKLKQFHENEKLYKSLTDELQSLKKQYDDMCSKLPRLNTSDNENDVETMIDLKDKIIALEKQLQSVENDDELEYLINTGEILFKYYDIVDKGLVQDDAQVSMSKTKVENSILKYLMQDKKEEPEGISNNDKAGLLEKYMAFTEPNYVKPHKNDQQEKCHFCESTNRNIMLNDGIIFCNDCHTVEYIIVDHDKPSYKSPPPEISYFSYKRINHLNELTSLFVLILKKLKLYSFI